MSDSLRPLGLYIACQAPLSVEFSRQEYWNGLPFPSPGDRSDPGIEPVSPASPALAGRFFTIEPPGKHHGQTLKEMTGGPVVRNLPAKAEDIGAISAQGRSHMPQSK